MGRPFLGTKPHALRLTPLELALFQRAAEAKGRRSWQAWAVAVAWDAACSIVSEDTVASLRVECAAPAARKSRKVRP
jgi:uncharacterized protein (DUF1778 family)